MKRILVAVMLLCLALAQAIELNDSGLVQAAGVGAASFVAVPGEIPDMKPIFDLLEESVFTNVMPVHLNADDKLDLAIHFYRLRFGAPGNNEACENRLVLLVQGTGNMFTDATSQLAPGVSDIGACMSWFDVADLNGDGKPDLALAASQEDGRDTTVWQHSFAQSVVLLSQPGGTYALEKVGRPDWYHHVGHLVDEQGRALLAIAGLVEGSQVWRRDASDWTLLSTNSSQDPPGAQPFPHVNAGAFAFYNQGGDPTGLSDTLIQAAPYPSVVSAMAEVRNGDGSWTRLPQVDLFPFMGTVRFVTWQGVEQSDRPVYRVDGLDTPSGAYLGACVFRVTPSSEPMVVMKLSMAYIVGGWTGPDQVVLEENLVNVTTLLAFRVEGGALVRADLPITNEQQHSMNARYFGCGDVTGDGLADLTVFPLGDPSPVVYQNNGAGGLVYIGQAQFPAHDAQWNHAGTSLLRDFDADGIPDLVRWPGAGWSSQFSNDVSFRFLKGTGFIGDDQIFSIFADSFEVAPEPD